MNSAFFNIARRFGVKWFFLLSTIIGLVGGGNAAWATDAVANFSGSVTTPPQVDATTFINSATWNISVSPKPFMTANTLNYTNNGTNMTSQIGWEFDLGPNNSGTPLTRGWSANFFNNTLGNISAVGRLSGSLSQPVPVGYLLVSATNIVNKGVLSADPYSELYLTGSSVDLHSSRVMITPFAGSGSANDFIANHNFTPDTGIFDEYWGQTNIVNMTSSAITSYGDYIYVITGNGVDDTHKHVVAPAAPGIICFDKNSGKAIWSSNVAGSNMGWRAGG